MCGQGRLRPHGGRERVAKHRIQALADCLLEPRNRPPYRSIVAVMLECPSRSFDGERVCALRDREGCGGVSELVEHEAIEPGRRAGLRPHAAEVRRRICDERATHDDHPIPVSQGGAKLDSANLQSLCKKCHGRKTTAEGHVGMKRRRSNVRVRDEASEGDAASLSSRTVAKERGPGCSDATGSRPSRPFTHDEGCRVVAVDPGVEIPWSYLGEGRRKAECVCGTEYINESAVDDRVRLDPLDPKTARHLGQCEYVSETDSSVLKVLLNVKPGMGRGLRLGRVRRVRRRLAGSALCRERLTTNSHSADPAEGGASESSAAGGLDHHAREIELFSARATSSSRRIPSKPSSA
jgi:hypothetical protein